MRRKAFYIVFTVILLIALAGLMVARNNFNNQYSAASQALGSP